MIESWGAQQLAQQILNCPCPMPSNDAGTTTIRAYLVELLAALWNQGEQFSGKRPLGNSGWRYDLYEALGQAGLIACRQARDDWNDWDEQAGDRLVTLAIRALGGPGS
jgi:hypothetical protein